MFSARYGTTRKENGASPCAACTQGNAVVHVHTMDCISSFFFRVDNTFVFFGR